MMTIVMKKKMPKSKEISEILGITEGNARVKMNRAKEKLRNLIKK